MGRRQRVVVDIQPYPTCKNKGKRQEHMVPLIGLPSSTEEWTNPVFHRRAVVQRLCRIYWTLLQKSRACIHNHVKKVHFSTAVEKLAASAGGNQTPLLRARNARLEKNAQLENQRHPVTSAIAKKSGSYAIGLWLDNLWKRNKNCKLAFFKDRKQQNYTLKAPFSGSLPYEFNFSFQILWPRSVF